MRWGGVALTGDRRSEKRVNYSTYLTVGSVPTSNKPYKANTWNCVWSFVFSTLPILYKIWFSELTITEDENMWGYIWQYPVPRKAHSRHCPPSPLPPPPHYHHHEDLENMYVLELVVRYGFFLSLHGPTFFNFTRPSPKAFGSSL